MKVLLLFLFSVGATHLIFAEETRAHIPYKIPDGTPPPPAPEKPVWTIPAADVITEKSHVEGGRTITVREIKPIALPPPPADNDGLANSEENDFDLDPNSVDGIGLVNLGFNEEITDYETMSFRKDHPSDLYEQDSVPGWLAAAGEHIEIWDEGDGNPYVELQSHLGAHGVKQEAGHILEILEEEDADGIGNENNTTYEVKNF
jgi:hypothetical protein